MARSAKKLSALDVKNRTKPGRHSDGDGLYLNIASGGTKSWVFIWMKDKRRREMGLGAYPTVSLSDAREKADECRKLVASGENPLQARSQEKPKTFEQATSEFLASMEHGWRNEKHREQWRTTLGEAYCKPLLNRAVNDIDTADVLKVLTPIWQSKAETASRIRGRIERVLDFAKVKGWRTGENPALWRGHLKNALPARQKLTRGHHSAMPYDDVPAFAERLGALESTSAKGLELLILTASRSGEILGAQWSEIDLKKGLWTVPASRMKAGKIHRVPLTERAVTILQKLHDGRVSDYVLPGAKKDRPLSNMAFAMLMRKMKLGHYTPHGFRSAFRDWAGDETSFPREVAEAALAHAVGDQTERAYRRSDALERRRKLMEAWASFCKGKSKVVQLHGT